MKFPKLQEDEIFKLKAEYECDTRKDKINGGIGVYLDNEGKPFILPTIKTAIKKLEFSNFNYLPLAGDPIYLAETAKLILGENLYKEYDEFLAKQGTIGGTNGIYMWARFVKEINKKPTIIIGSPTWENHLRMFSYFGFKIIEYPHLTGEKKFNLLALKKLLIKNPKTYVLFQGGPTHNPIGINPDDRQWLELAEIIEKHQQQVIFDYAYPGLGDSLESDNFCIRHFLIKRIPLSFAVSFSKNMTLYQHRAGALFIAFSTKREKELAEKLLQNTFRLVNSNPAAFAEDIVKTILTSKELKANWQSELSQMRANLNFRREKFIRLTGERFAYLKFCRGLFALLFLTPKQINYLKKNHALYLLSNSRINFGGISLKNIAKVSATIMALSY